MKRMICLILCMLVMTGCAVEEPARQTAAPEKQTEEKENEKMLNMMIGDTAVEVVWEDNGSVSALTELAAESPLSIQMSMYGGFEQVGPIGTSL
ncbi:MAG: hypothetical protein Q4D46_11820, partial [Erysipelotrichaceae bacterium]|nr:hypothetical protein [Erysipelotrichaceae bacterium]